MHSEGCFPLALTYEDVLLVPCRSAVTSRRDVDTGTRLTRDLRLNIPIVSANMDTVTEARMARAMAREGGIGVIHRFMAIEQEAAEVQRVKRPEEAVGGRQLHTIAPTRTLAEAMTLMGRHNARFVIRRRSVAACGKDHDRRRATGDRARWDTARASASDFARAPPGNT